MIKKSFVPLINISEADLSYRAHRSRTTHQSSKAALYLSPLLWQLWLRLYLSPILALSPDSIYVLNLISSVRHKEIQPERKGKINKWRTGLRIWKRGTDREKEVGQSSKERDSHRSKIYLSIDLSINLPIYLSIYRSTYPSIYPSTHPCYLHTAIYRFDLS